MENIIIEPFKDTGINEVNIDNVIKQWNHLWFIAEWQRDNSWRLIRYLRKDSPITKLKVTISWEQANELVKRLNLISINSAFASGFSWRRKEDIEYLEEWKDIEGYESVYEISNLGRIKSLSNTGKTKKGFISIRKEKILKPGVCGSKNSKYLFVVLRKDGKNNHMYVHRLVAIHFTPNPENKRTVNHKDLNRLNNDVNNLEWASHKENINHSWNKGACNPHGGGQKITKHQALEIIKALKNKNVLIKELAFKYGISRENIYNIRAKRVWINLPR